VQTKGRSPVWHRACLRKCSSLLNMRAQPSMSQWKTRICVTPSSSSITELCAAPVASEESVDQAGASFLSLGFLVGRPVGKDKDCSVVGGYGFATERVTEDGVTGATSEESAERPAAAAACAMRLADSGVYDM
jgi:hypothetical protein